MQQKVTLGARLLLGLMFTIFGLNGFLNFIPMPASIPEAAMKFSGAMMDTHYFFPFLKSTEVICGLLLLSGFFSPLALIILAPITLNILLFHIFLEPSGVMMAIVIILLQLIAAYGYKDKYSAMLKAK
jgi:putative oxidoreductase